MNRIRATPPCSSLACAPHAARYAADPRQCAGALAVAARGRTSAPAGAAGRRPGFRPAGTSKAACSPRTAPVDDLVTHESFGNFELELEWKIGKAGNSGVFYRGTREYDHIYWSAPEYQLLDDANAPDGKNRLTAAAAAYALYGAPAGVVLPFDHWNKTRIVVKGNHVEHWLNGRKVVEYELKSADWKEQGRGEQVRGVPQLRSGGERPHRPAGRSPRSAGDSQHPYSRAA